MEGARYCKAGAFVWPPRSYVCNFCSREFGSAQALGGHMNVHRRDRARLNQSTGISTEEKKPETAVIDGKKEKYISRKRWRCDEFPLPLFPFFTKLSKSKKAHLQEEVKGLCVGAAQELDLELRLGFSLI